jgi:hypothetical protein
MRAPLLLVALAATVRVAAGDPVRVRWPEGATRGFVVVSAMDGTRIGDGELLQTVRGAMLTSRFTVRFDDGSLYDETIRFTQRPVFRIRRYRLAQRGRRFTQTQYVRFDDRGRYRVRQRSRADADWDEDAGTSDIPADVSNGMIATLVKNLPPGTSATTHLVAFTPSPHVVALHLRPDGDAGYRLGDGAARATRWTAQAEVTGLLGILASVAGKQPPPIAIWMTRPPVPTLLRLEGPLYADGPTWRFEPGAPRWRPVSHPR